MSVRVEFHFDLGSPNAYLAHLALPGIASRTGVPFEHVPVLLGGVFGSPSFFVGDELYFGKDRLRDVEEEIVRVSG